MTGEEKKGACLSKKELKKLAKKAEKEAAKAEKKGGGSNPVSGSSSGSVGKKESKSLSCNGSGSSKGRESYLVAQASEGDASSLKASIAAAAFEIPVAAAPRNVSFLPFLPFLQGPALLAPLDGRGNGEAFGFGGNGIAKALSLLSGKAVSPVMDDWLEFERTCLRTSPIKEAHLQKVQEALSENGGHFLVGDSLSAVDIAVVVTLSQPLALQQVSSLQGLELLETYISSHSSSQVFVKGREAVASLVPRPPFDAENNPSLLQTTESAFAEAIAASFPSAAQVQIPTKVERSKQLKFGDYQCSVAMPLFQKLKAISALSSSITNPPQHADAILAAIPPDNPILDSFLVNGPGFILYKIKPSYLQYHLTNLHIHR